MKFHESYTNLINSETKIKLVEFLLGHEASMSEREIASIISISHMSVNRIMRELADMNLVFYKVVGKAHLWKVNRKSSTYNALKQLIANLKVIPDPLIELKSLILKHLKKAKIKKVVLFGSIVRKTEEPDSDIDIFILVKNVQDQNSIEEAIENLSDECLDVFGNRLSPYILTERQYKEKKGLDVITQVNKGVQLIP